MDHRTVTTDSIRIFFPARHTSPLPNQGLHLDLFRGLEAAQSEQKGRAVHASSQPG